MPGAGAYPAFLADNDGDRLIHHLDLQHSLLLALNQRSARVCEGLGIGLDFFDHEAAQGGGAAQQFFEFFLVFQQLFQLLLDLDGLQPRQLPQANVQDVIGLNLRQLEARNQRFFGLISLTDDGNHLVDIEQHNLAALQNVNARQHLVQPVL